MSFSWRRTSRLLFLLPKLVLALVALVIVLGVLTLAALQTRNGQALAGRLVSALASAPGAEIVISDIRLSWGLDAAISRIELSDARGPYLTVADLAVNWRPIALLAGALDIEQATVAQVDLARLPEPPESAAETSEPSGDGGLPGIPLALKHFAIEDIRLGQEVAGAAMTLTASGDAWLATGPTTLAGTLSIARTDGTKGTVLASARFAPEEDTLTFSVAVDEPRGGLAARLLEVPGLPALSLSLEGDGPLDDWRADLQVKLDGATEIAGNARLTRDGTERDVTLTLGGALAPLAPPMAEAFLLGQTALSANARLGEDFTPLSLDAKLTTETLRATSTARYAPGTGSIDLTTQVALSAGAGAMIALELPDRRIALGESDVTLSASGTLSALDWSAAVTSQSLDTQEARLDGIDLRLAGSGTDLAAEEPELPFTLDATIGSLTPRLPGMESLAGPLKLGATGRVFSTESRIALDRLTLDHPAAALALTKAGLSPTQVSGDLSFRLPDLAAFAALSGQQLAGTAEGTLTASLDPETLAGELNAAMTARDLSTGIAQADAFLTEPLRLTMTAQGDSDGLLTLSALSLEASGVKATASGTSDLQTVTADLRIDASGLDRIDPRVEGDLTLEAKLSGPLTGPKVAATLRAPTLMLAGKPVGDLALDADISTDRAALAANIEISALVDGARLEGQLAAKPRGAGLVAETLSLRLGRNAITGQFSLADLAAPLDGLAGKARIEAPDLAAFSTLALTELSGALSGEISISPENGTPQAVVALTGSDIAAGPVRIGSVNANATLRDPAGAPQAEGTVSLGSLDLSGTPVARIDATARTEGASTAFTVDARLSDTPTADGVALEGALEPNDTGLVLSLARLDGRYMGIDTRLTSPARILHGSDGVTRIEALTLGLGNGSLAVTGSAGETLALDARLTSIPLALANAFTSGLGISGTASGTAKVTGTPAAPRAAWSIALAALSAEPLRSNGLPPLAIASEGTFANDRVTQTTRVTGPEGLAITATGPVSLAAPTRMDIDIAGSAPLALARQKLILSGFSGNGTFDIAGKVSGPLTGPRYSATIRPRGVTLTQLSSGFTLNGLAGQVDVSNAGAALNGIRANIAGGGTVTVGGRVSFDAGIPADIDVAVQNGRYSDGRIVTATINAALALNGPLADAGRAARLSGTVTIPRAEITIPSTFPGAIDPVAVVHRHPPAAVRAQDRALRRDEGGGSGDSGGSAPIALDLTVTSPGQMFVRGRGLDAEMGGTLRIAGTVAAPNAVGGFSMRRGRMDLLRRRLTFDKGNVSFTGSLTPSLDFAATTQADGTSITITVKGEADAPVIALTSAPDLPQDEILARLLFGRSMSELSPLQIAQLGASVLTLTGGSGEGPLGSLRNSLGLDAIDIDAGGAGGPSVSVGKYLNENIYLGVKQGTESNSSRVTVDIDVTKSLKLRGEMGADGESKAGIFYEREFGD